MPIHDWTRVHACAFHDFHNRWITHLTETLNATLLPKGYYAQSEQITHHNEATGIERVRPDVLTLHAPNTLFDVYPAVGATVLEAPPQTQRGRRGTSIRPQRHIVVRHVTGHRVVAWIEIVSSANKDRLTHLDEFIGKVVDALQVGIHVLIVDLYPPGLHDPHGLYPLLAAPYPPPDPPPAATPLLFASCVGAPSEEIFLLYSAVGLELPVVSLFLTTEYYVKVPLEPAYQLAWAGTPSVWREVLAPSE